MHCNPTSIVRHGYVIVVVDYFTKRDKEIPTHAEDGNIVYIFLFSHAIARFGVPQSIFTDQGSHFRNHMMTKLSTNLGFYHENSTLYYSQVNGQVEAFDNVLKNMLHRMVGDHKSNWNLTLFPHCEIIEL